MGCRIQPYYRLFAGWHCVDDAKRHQSCKRTSKAAPSAFSVNFYQIYTTFRQDEDLKTNSYRILHSSFSKCLIHYSHSITSSFETIHDQPGTFSQSLSVKCLIVFTVFSVQCFMFLDSLVAAGYINIGRCWSVIRWSSALHVAACGSFCPSDIGTRCWQRSVPSHVL